MLTAGTRIWGGLITLDELVHGDWHYGLIRGRDAEGKRYLVATEAAEIIERHRAELEGEVPGMAPALAIGRDGHTGFLIEAEPDGRPTDEITPLRPSEIRAAALVVARRLEAIGASPFAIHARPDTIYLHRGEVSGISGRWARTLIVRSHDKKSQTRVGWSIPLAGAFLSPEGVRGEAPGSTADVFTLGVCLAFWLTGESPFQVGESPMQVAVGIVMNQRRPVPARTKIWDLVDAMLVSDAAARPSPAEVIRRLEALTPADVGDRRHGQDPVTRARLIGEIVAAPRDDTPRLVFGDWLMEHGEPRGELIQVQCRLASTSSAALRAREAELLPLVEPELTAHLRPWASEWTIERGFVSRICCAFRDYAQRVERLREEGPLPDVTDPDLRRAVHGGAVIEAGYAEPTLWDLATGRSYQLPARGIRSLRFEDGGRVVRAGLADGTRVDYKLDELRLKPA